ncbi:MAG: hypothetical protein LBM98_10715 [Oscillospiraceae bacterium]|nr:hypothetical protein [Oscillospiraceae bacterium]
MLRACNALRIAGVPALRNDGAGFALAPAHKGGFETRPYEPQQPSVQTYVIIHYQLS